MQELRQSTEIKIRVGSAVDYADGVTPITTLALGAADQAELLKHNGAATVDISASTFAAVTAVDGWYDLTLTAGNTDTLGQMTAVIQDSSLMAPIFRDFMVVTANYWDSKYSTDTRQVDVTQIGGVAQSASDLKDFADAGYDPATHRTQAHIKATDNIDLSATQKTSVNTEVADVLKTDLVTEMSQAAPPASPTMVEMFAYIYFMFRNKNVETTSEHSVYDNAGTTKLFKCTMVDSAGTFTKGEYASGV